MKLLLLITAPIVTVSWGGLLLVSVTPTNAFQPLSSRQSPPTYYHLRRQEHLQQQRSLRPPNHRVCEISCLPSTTTALGMARKILYGHPGTRSPLINWGAYEVGVDLTMAKDLSLNPHPFGQLPCLTDSSDDNDNEIVVFESGAILLYLHELTKEKLNLSLKDAAAITSWITWANASLDPICFLETPDGKVYDTGLKQPNKRLDQLDKILAKQKFLLDNNGGFSLADVAVASYLLYVLQFFRGIDVSRWPNMKRYMKDCASRPAYGKAFGENVQKYLVEQLSEEVEPEKAEKKLFGMF